MRFDFVRPGGVWPSEYVPGAADYQRLDVRAAKVLNGDLGGTYAPAKPIIVGGAGMDLQQVGSAAFQAGIVTATGGRVEISATANDAVTFAATRSRTIVIPIIGNLGIDQVSGRSGFVEAETAQAYVGASLIGSTSTSISGTAVQIPKRYLHQGARIATVGYYFNFTSRPTVVPSQSPYIDFAPVLGSNPSGTTLTMPEPGVLALTGEWQAAHTYGLNAYVVPSSVTQGNPLYFKSTAISGTGTSAGSEPVWPTTVGGTVVDNPGANQITWTAIGRSGILPITGTSVDKYWNNGDGLVVAFDTDPTAPIANNTVAADVNAYELALFNQAGTSAPILLTAAFVVLDTIADMRPE